MMKIGSQEERKLHDCALADLLPIGIFYADVQGRYLAVNQRWCEIARGIPSQSQGDRWIKNLYPNDQKPVFAAWKQAVQNHLKFEYEYRFQHPDGTLTWVLSQAVPETDSKGVVIGYVGTITDITERKQTEAELHQRCHRLESLLQKYTTQCQHTHQQLQQKTFKCQCLEEALQQSEALSSRLTQNITQLQQTEETLALRNRELLTLHRISEIHLSTQSLQAAFQDIVEEISTATNFPICAIELYDASRQMMVFEAVKGVPLPANSGVLEVPADQTLSGTVVLTGEPVIKIYAPNEPKNCDSNETLKKLGIKTFICMPMKIHERTIGTLSLAHSEVVQLDEYLPRWIASLANYVASLTEHQRAQTELRQMNERFQLATTAVNGLIYDWNLETNQVQRTQGLVNLLGYHPQEAEPMAAWWRERIHPDDWLRLNPVVMQSLAHEQMYALEYRIRHKNNQYLYVWDRGLILRDTEGRAVRVVGSTMDITVRKRMEETLQQQFLREQLLGTISQRIHQSFNLSEILQTTVAEIRHFLTCDRVIIYRFQPDWSGIVAAESVGTPWQPIAGTLIHDCCFAQSYAQLYQQGRVQAIEDIYTAGLSACHIELLAQYQVKASLIAPIVTDNEQLWGLLVAYQCSGTRQWQSLEIDLLKHLATQAAIAIQKSELYELSQAELMQRQQVEAALRQQVLKERLMAESAQRIRQSLNLDEILNTTVSEVRQFLDCDRTLIFRFGPDWSGVVAVESVTQEWTAILGTTIYDPCFELSYVQPYQAGRVKAIPDIYAAGLSQCHINLLAQFQVKANLVVPILQGERLWGLLIAHQCRGRRQWQPLEIDLLKQLGTQVGIAIQQSQLYKQTQHQVEREQAVNRVTQSIRNSLDLTTIFSTAVAEIAQLLKTDRADIMQYLPDRQVWQQVATYPYCLDSLPGLSVDVPDADNEIAAQLKRLEIVRIDDASSRIRDGINRNIAQTHPGAWLLVPLHTDSSIWGSLSLVRHDRSCSWQDSEVELVCAIADQLAIALQQAELYKQSRTATAQALSQAKELEQTLNTLQKTQAQLVQSEKMSSLGQLVAGVAHEINNPVTFISANLTHAENYTQDILGLIELYQQQYPHPTPDIHSEMEAIDLEFLIDDLPKLLSSMKVGADRICEIIMALRNFSRHAEAEIKAVDIHEGLDSTLMILQNRLKASGKHPEIQVIKEYGNLPKVECCPGQLNQVFMNLLSNAIDAIDEYNETRSVEEIKTNPSIIRIHTQVDNESQVVIRIADNGPGMKPQIQSRIFDPFFTTKPVGAGTGLGLSISYQIVVEKHGGQLYCESVLGKGTEFVIEIPIGQMGVD
jgi:PAS domain S-box-containing protein